MNIFPRHLRTFYRTLLILTCCIFLNAHGKNGSGGTGAAVLTNGTGGTGYSVVGGAGISTINGSGGTGIRGVAKSGGVGRLGGFKGSKKVAVLVGVENYNTQVSGFSSLNYAVDDVNLLKNTFKKQGYSVYSLADTQATKQKVIETINMAAKTLNNGDGTLVFSFSGHGLAQGKNNYLATYDARLSTLKNTAISVKEITEAIRKTGVKRAVLFVDACRNDPFRGARTAGNTLIRTWLGGEGIQILYGTGNRLLSLEDPTLSSGVFTYFVNKGLNGADGARVADGTIDFESLSSYVMREVPRYTERNLGRKQQPWRGGEEHFGDFILAAHPDLAAGAALASLSTKWINSGVPSNNQAEQQKDKLEKARREQHKLQIASLEKANKAKRAQEAKTRAVVIARRNNEILKRRKAINANHSLKKKALQIECRNRSNILRSQFQRRMLDYDIALRKRLNTLPHTMLAQQRSQAESRLKANTLQQKRTLNDDNKHRQLVITRDCSDKARLLDRRHKLRIHEFERTLSKR